MIKRVTGRAPPTCPWRAFYAPIVREVLEVSWAIGGDLAAVIGTDPDAKLAAAIGVYRRALEATRAAELRCLADDKEAERKARAQLHGGSGRNRR